MVNIGTGVAPVNIAFSSSRSVAFSERKMLQNTVLSIKLYQYTFSKIKKPTFSIRHGSETTLNPGFFNEIY